VFHPPTIEELTAYISEKGYHFDPEEMICYYGSQGWKKKNGQKLTSWQLACGTFERTWKERHPEPETFSRVLSMEDIEKYGYSPVTGCPGPDGTWMDQIK